MSRKKERRRNIEERLAALEAAQNIVRTPKSVEAQENLIEQWVRGKERIGVDPRPLDWLEAARVDVPEHPAHKGPSIKRKLKPIDWSDLSKTIPVKVWNDDEPPIILYPKIMNGWPSLPMTWQHQSLITGIDVAWVGCTCPLPKGVLVDVHLRNGDAIKGARPSSLCWLSSSLMLDPCHAIMAFRVTAIADGYTEEQPQ